MIRAVPTPPVHSDPDLDEGPTPPTFPRERVGAALVVLGMIMLIVTVRVWVGTPGPAFWCCMAAFALLGLGAVLAYTQVPTPDETPATDETINTLTSRPDYVDNPNAPGVSVTPRPPSPFAPPAGDD